MIDNSLDLTRDAQVLALRSAGWTYKRIGLELGVTRQRAQQVWERATAPRPAEACWCGKSAPVVSGPGRPAKYCSPEHQPSRPVRKRAPRGVNRADAPKPPKPPRPPKPPQRRRYEACTSCGAMFERPRLRKSCAVCTAAARARRKTEEYERRLTAQGGVCAICKRSETALASTGMVKRLSVDHCHTSGRTRELLCMRCNTMLGLAKDRPELMLAGAAYLRKHAV